MHMNWLYDLGFIVGFVLLIVIGTFIPAVAVMIVAAFLGLLALADKFRWDLGPMDDWLAK